MPGVIDYTYLNPETNRDVALERMATIAWWGRLTLATRRLVKITLNLPEHGEMSFYAERRPVKHR